MALTITSANAVYMLAIPGVALVPQQLQGFGVDEAFDTEPSETAEAVIGVDGVAVSGWLPRLTQQTITLLASSPSVVLFDAWLLAEDTAREVIYATGTIILPSIQRKFTLSQGTLLREPQIPNARRVLQQRQFRIAWGWPITSAPL